MNTAPRINAPGDASLVEKARFLSMPQSYPHAPLDVRAIETHMSLIFLADEKAFKLKKPVRFPFLDFSTVEAREAMCREEVGERDDVVLGRPLRRGRGVILNTQSMYGPNRNTYGHSGAGGSVGLADPALKLGIGYTMNQMQPGIETDTRGNRLLRAVMDALT